MPEFAYSEIIIQFLGGLGLFIYGMHIMASGLQKSAGSKLRKLLEALTKNKWMGVLVGAFVTAIIQSSSATTVMVVGFVNAGLLNLTQSVGIIMGANIGTTVTGWLVASVEWSKFLNPVYLAPIFVAVGAALAMFSQKNFHKLLGEIFVGFGILFIGMDTMANSVEPLKDLPAFSEIFLMLGSNPILGILAGTVVTGIIQSSSASVGILQSLALVGLVPWNAAVYIIMGQNIGTCVTALLSSIGTTRNAKAAAYIHLSFNVIGSIIFSILAVIYFHFINPALGSELITVTQISIVHTGFNIANTLMLYNFSDYLITLANFFVNSSKTSQDETSLEHLNQQMLQNPSFALESCIKEIVRLGNLALENLKLSAEALLEKDQEKVELVFKREKNIDTLDHGITDYLVKLCNTDISEDDKTFITSLFHAVNDCERIGDHSENLAELAVFENEHAVELSGRAKKEIEGIIQVATECVAAAVKALETESAELADAVMIMEKKIDDMEKSLRAAHIQRLANNECSSSAGVVFLDSLTNLERISDHACNIAEVVLRKVSSKTL